MEKPATQEKCYTINNIEYSLKLIPTKYHNEKNSCIITKFKARLDKILYFSRVEGRVE